MHKRWVINTAEDPCVSELATAIKIDPVLARILINRGIKTYDEAKAFFRPSLENLHDPFLMKDMDRAISRIIKAIENKERILIYGDYDVDGTTSVALVFSFFKTFYSNIDFYIPDRYKEGYGISFAGIDYAVQSGVSLIIALDCGIKANDKVDYANNRKIDFIICDHHLPGEKIPDAVAILDPKRHDCNYPFNELSGCGIGFKLIQAFSIKKGIAQSVIEPYLDLVAISIGADIVPITGENRILAYFGLKQINGKPRKGIEALLKLSALKKEQLTITDVVFTLGPRINAAGRIERGSKAVELLISETIDAADKLAGEININNQDRRELDVRITKEALEMINSNPELQVKKSTVVYSPDWHKGVIGIVASRLTEKYYRPTIVLTHSNGYAMGSARSVQDYDVHAAIESCSDLLEQFGGHKYAAGLSMKIENLEKFISKFETIVSSTIDEALLTPMIEVDAILDLNKITPGFNNILKQFAPFGPGNMAPVFLSEQVVDKGYGKTVGNDNAHLRLEIGMNDHRKNFIPAIGFNMGRYFSEIRKKQSFRACYTIEENHWQGQTNLQLNLKDLKFDPVQ